MRSGQKPSVLFLSPWYPDEEAPTEGTFIQEHARAAATVADVVVLHVAQSEATRGVARSSDVGSWGRVTVYRIRFAAWRLPKTTTLRHLLAALTGLRAVVRDGFRPDVVHGHIFGSALPAYALSRKIGCPVLLTEQSSAFGTGRLTRTGRFLARVMMRRMDRVLPVSNALRRAIEGQGVRARFRVVPNAVDLELFCPGGSRDRVPGRMLFVGRLVREKGLETLIEALAGMHDPRLSLEIVGDGPLRDRLRGLAEERGLTSRITFLGPMDHAKVGDRMRRADMLVLPSDPWESLPCVLIEGLASGLPVVATRVGGVEEIVDATCGVLVQAGDAKALRHALADATQRFADVDRHRIAQSAARFGRQRVGQELRKVYEEVLGD